MAAFTHAVALGVDTLELDLGMTRDGVLVVAHDPRVDGALCDGDATLLGARIKDLSYQQLATLDCGSKRHPRFPHQVPVPGARMPRLEQVLDLLGRHPGLRASVEIKTFPEQPRETHPPARFAAALMNLLAARDVAPRVTVQSFDPRALAAVRARAAPGTPRPILAALVRRRAEFEPALRATGATILSPRHTVLRRRDAASLRARGVRVIPWTVNAPARMRTLVEWGVDGLITDRPDLLLRLLQRRRGLW